MKKQTLMVAIIASLLSFPAWAEMPADMKMPAEKMEHKQKMQHHDHSVEKGTLPPNHNHEQKSEAKLVDKDGKPMQAHDHTKDRH